MARRRFSPCPALAELVSATANLTPSSTCSHAPSKRGPLTGRVNLHHRGFGFVTTMAADAYYLPADLIRPVLTGDVVEFEAAPAKSLSFGQAVTSVSRVRRDSGLMLGELCRHEGGWHLRPDEPCFVQLVLAEANVAANAATEGDVVAVRLPAYEGPPQSRPIAVVLDRVLGSRGRPGFSQDYALVRHGFHEVMPVAVKLEAEALGVQPGSQIADLSLDRFGRTPFVTIDGEHTCDFDDAVYAARQGDGWLVQVAIADVSWYVRPGSALDLWASSRGTSVYLPGQMIPMLPESLSTGLCALAPGKARRAVVMTLVLDAAGQVRKRDLERAWICSAARLTYGEVSDFLAGRGSRYTDGVERNLMSLAAVHDLLSADRKRKGVLSFEDPDPVLKLASAGGWRLEWEMRTVAHKLIEELMLLSNRVAAEMLLTRYGAGVFRHQPAPTVESWQALRAWARGCGHDLPDKPTMSALVGLSSIQADADGLAAAIHRIRACMSSASYVFADYSAASHFSLSFEGYTHFTSPIRRYADLMVHRLLLAQRGPSADPLFPEHQAGLAAAAAHCSERGRASRLAERRVWDEIKLQCLVADVARDQILLARIARITPRGLRVVIRDWQTSAWLPARELKSHGFCFRDDAWRALHTGSPLQEGYSLRVRWVHVLQDRPAYPELQVALVASAQHEVVSVGL